MRESKKALLLDVRLTHRAQRVKCRRALLILVPCHPQCLDEAAQVTKRAGLRVARRDALSVSAVGLTDFDRLAEAGALPGDSMDEMVLYYSVGEVAFVGDSLLPLGRQNLIEACVAGTPMVTDPHAFDSAQTTRDTVAASTCAQVADAVIAVRVIDAWLFDADARGAVSCAALASVTTRSGAMARMVGAVASLILPTLQRCVRPARNVRIHGEPDRLMALRVVYILPSFTIHLCSNRIGPN